MARVLAIVQIVALLGLTAVCIAVVALLLQARRELDEASSTLQRVAQKAALDLDESHRLILEAGLTAMEARKASAQERAALPGLTAQANRSFRELDAVMRAARAATDGVNASQQAIAASTVRALDTVDLTVRNLQPVMEQAQATFGELRVVEADLDTRVNDPAIAESLQHIERTTAALEATARDVQTEVHAITHPTWVKRVWSGLLDVAHVFNPL